MLSIVDPHWDSKVIAMDRLLDKMETATKLGVSVATLDRLRRRTDFPRPFRISRQRVAFPEREVEEWLVGQREHAA